MELQSACDKQANVEREFLWQSAAGIPFEAETDFREYGLRPGNIHVQCLVVFIDLNTVLSVGSLEKEQ